MCWRPCGCKPNKHGRLMAFAHWQAQSRTQGYRIQQSECSVTEEHRISLPGGTTEIYLRGRIDRIDVHETTGDTIVFDYKTGDTAKKPHQVHLKRGATGTEWIDLQLPLYRHLVRALGIEQTVRLGYIVLPKDTGEVTAHFADWDDATLADADAKALEVMLAIRAEKFWPPAESTEALRMFPEFAAICQDDLLVVSLTSGEDAEEDAS